MPSVWRVLVVLLLAGSLTGCSGSDSPTGAEPTRAPTITVTSAAFGAGEEIPRRYTCDGEEVSPPLAWSGSPSGAVMWAVVVDDPDAPGGTFTHWVVLDIPVDVVSIAEGQSPAGGVVARGSSGTAAYVGPCPPDGSHHYRFTVYALSGPTGLKAGSGLGEALSAIEEHTVAWGRLTAVYAR